MSLVSDALYPGACDGLSVAALRNACRAAKERGILVVASSGDSGNPESLRSPACFTSVVAVGSAAEVPPDAMSTFTDRSDALDLLAPGENITSAAIGGGQVTVSGTSQACAHVSGVVALLREISPELDPDATLALLEATGAPVSDPRSGLTFPRIDALRAVLELTGVEDCDGNDVPDRLDLALGKSGDLDGNGVPDSCEGAAYIRGDANEDGHVNLSDPIRLFDVLFGGHADLGCERAADANADGQANIADAVYLLNFLFVGGEAPPPPYPDCALHPGDGELSCAAHAACE